MRRRSGRMSPLSTTIERTGAAAPSRPRNDRFEPRTEQDAPGRDKTGSSSGGEDEKDADENNADDKGEDGKQDGKDKPRSRWPFVILGIVVLLAVVGGAIYWFLTRNLVGTDDAYTNGNSVSVAAKVSGYVTVLNVNDNTVVHAGDLLLRIDPRDYVTARDQARANLLLAQAQLASARIDLEETTIRAPATLLQAQAQLKQAEINQKNAKLNFDRQQSVDPRATTRTNVDQSTAQFRGNVALVDSARAQVQIAALVSQTVQTAVETVHQREAQVDQTRAALAQAEINLSYTEIRAAQDGKITMRNVERGTYAQVGQQLFYLVTPYTWVVANYKENQLARMLPGQPVSMTVDAYPALKLSGHVDSIQQGSGAQFSAFPAENATGNFVKIVQRVPVKIVIDSGLKRDEPLPLGVSVEPTVTLK